MANLISSSIDVPETASDDPRVGHLLGRSAPAESADTVIVGFPSDEGVRLNRGRPGAAEGPARIREYLYRLTPDARSFGRFSRFLQRTVDLGDIVITGNVDHDQEVLGEVLAPYLKRGAVPIILGGGHETAFGHFLGYVYCGKPVRILNWDAHPDVRPPENGRAHSGSSFYQALLHISETCRGYKVLGLAPYQTSSTHLDFVEAKGGAFVWAEDVQEETIREAYGAGGGAIMTSFDLDAVNQAEAPGVSAPCSSGLAARTWLQAAFEAGRCRAATSFDVVELNPQFDADDRTARLAALTVWSILKGMSERSAHSDSFR